ncbi:hypothetical protein M404DRAFT_34220 [Pisolithus tinctorius Marx 270]|uniref:Uncharacterized protein n=1 Tax=Pisolithus tinctorius Marx 270 TaxID=870435 RepID=A0A0C3NJ64_PISTI|nr:hypothetical protein M404DRAFT_34220 [Pisolithus tinctorius Marx 270]
MGAEAGEAPTTLPTGEDAAGAEVDMAGSDELLADAEGSTTSVVPDKNNGADRAVQAKLCCSRRDAKNWEALPFLSSFVLDVPHRVHILNTNGWRKPHLLSPRASNNYILSVALAVALFVLAIAHTHEATLTRPRNPNLPLPSRQANASILLRILADEVILSERTGEDARRRG